MVSVPVSTTFFRPEPRHPAETVVADGGLSETLAEPGKEPEAVSPTDVVVAKVAVPEYTGEPGWTLRVPFTWPLHATVRSAATPVKVSWQLSGLLGYEPVTVPDEIVTAPVVALQPETLPAEIVDLALPPPDVVSGGEKATSMLRVHLTWPGAAPT